MYISTVKIYQSTWKALLKTAKPAHFGILTYSYSRCIFRIAIRVLFIKATAMLLQGLLASVVLAVSFPCDAFAQAGSTSPFVKRALQRIQGSAINPTAYDGVFVSLTRPAHLPGTAWNQFADPAPAEARPITPPRLLMTVKFDPDDLALYNNYDGRHDSYNGLYNGYNKDLVDPMQAPPLGGLAQLLYNVVK
jgi:hypothetical protein